ncbi:unnamed protein product, partial [Larinioides sclopetarius]
YCHKGKFLASASVNSALQDVACKITCTGMYCPYSHRAQKPFWTGMPNFAFLRPVLT